MNETPRMRYRALITDIDGTLLNAERELSRLTLDVLGDAGRRVRSQW